MSGSTAKATRRDIRRAVGPTAISAITEQGELLARHDSLLERQRLQIDTLRRDDTIHAGLGAALKARVEACEAFQARTLGQRLRWLLTGRV